MPFARLPLLVLLGACGGSPTTPSGPVEDFPRVTAGSEARTGCPFPPGSSLYMVPGLSDHVVDPSAASLEARVTVGEERLYLNVEGYGCGSWYDPAWESTNPAAAPVTPLTGFFSEFCVLEAHAPGQTRIFATFKVAGDGNTYRTTLAYCPPTPDCLTRAQGRLTGGCACPNPRRIDTVTVVPK